MSTTDIPVEADDLPAEAVEEGPRLLRSITLRNLLSFGPETPPLELRSLNVLIGPNGSGKSNLIDAISLLRSMTVDPRIVIADGGGIEEWIWKGSPHAPLSISVVAHDILDHQGLRHTVALEGDPFFGIGEETIEDADSATPECYYRLTPSGPEIRTTKGMVKVTKNFDQDLPVLSQRKDPEHYIELFFLASHYERMALYREWSFGRKTVFRTPQRADMPNGRLMEDFSNLGLVLNRLRRNPKAKATILTRLRDLYEGLTDYDVSIEGGAVQVFFTEGDYVIPATRLSDGSLRYLCLLAILCDPEPPPLVCIEEPELGLHPDIVVKIAELLVEASERTQLIVTTHSEMLVDYLTERPESVVVCEKHAGQTTMRRLSAEKLKVWLEKYRLGPLWTSGHLGGNRW